MHTYFPVDNSATIIPATGFVTQTNGVYDEVTRYTTMVGGVATNVSYALNSTGLPFTPAADAKFADKPKAVLISMTTLSVLPTAAGGQAITVPTLLNADGENCVNWATVGVQVDDASTAAGYGGISYTVNGAAPSEAVENELRSGASTTLDSRGAVSGFRALPINNNGTIITTGAVPQTLSIVLYNIDPVNSEAF